MTKPNDPAAAQKSTRTQNPVGENPTSESASAADLITEVERIEGLMEKMRPSADHDYSLPDSGTELIISLFDAFPALAEAVRRGERMREALKMIAWSNDSKWQSDCAKQALADAGNAQTSAYQYDETTIKARYP